MYSTRPIRTAGPEPLHPHVFGPHVLLNFFCVAAVVVNSEPPQGRVPRFVCVCAGPELARYVHTVEGRPLILIGVFSP